MKFFYSLVVCLFIRANSLLPNRMPSGNPRIFHPNIENPCRDIETVDSSKVSFIAKHWVNNIMVAPQINKEDKHILERIKRLDLFVQYCDGPQIRFMVWKPLGPYDEVLFLVVSRIREKRNGDFLCVKLLIQSPFWDSEQINSKELKNALESLCKESEMKLDLSFVFEMDMRYKLEWYDFASNATVNTSAR